MPDTEQLVSSTSSHQPKDRERLEIRAGDYIGVIEVDRFAPEQVKIDAAMKLQEEFAQFLEER